MRIEIKGNKTIIEETEDSPAILMDLDEKKIIFEGPSFPEDAIEFYRPVIDWINNHYNKLDSLDIIFDYTILSSASNKMVYEILLKLEKMQKEGKKVSVKWYYEDYDEDMRDEGKGFKMNMKIPFDILPKKSDND